jgi:hypothetical protein
MPGWGKSPTEGPSTPHAPTRGAYGGRVRFVPGPSFMFWPCTALAVGWLLLIVLGRGRGERAIEAGPSSIGLRVGEEYVQAQVVC